MIRKCTACLMAVDAGQSSAGLGVSPHAHGEGRLSGYWDVATCTQGSLC